MGYARVFSRMEMIRILAVIAIISSTLVVTSCLCPTTSKPLNTSNMDEEKIPPQPDSDHLWIEPYSTENGIRLPGFWRPSQRDGFTWVEGKEVMSIWVPGYWQPTEEKSSDKIWVQGHVSSAGVWIEGYWRDSSRQGFNWVRGFYEKDGSWVKGLWKSAE